MSALCPPLAPRVFATDRRRTSRTDVSIAAAIRDREGAIADARIVNISASGFMAVSETPYCERAPVRVELGGLGWARATVVWALGDRFGAVFLTPIGEETLDQLADTFEETIDERDRCDA